MLQSAISEATCYVDDLFTSFRSCANCALASVGGQSGRSAGAGILASVCLGIGGGRPLGLSSDRQAMVEFVAVQVVALLGPPCDTDVKAEFAVICGSSSATCRTGG